MNVDSPIQPRRSVRGRPRGLELRSRHRRVSLCETLDRVLNKGAVVTGDIIISVADVPLVYIGVNLVVASVETMREWSQSSQARNTREAVSPALSEVEEPASRVMEA